MANLTLTIDGELLKRARMRALERDTSVNALVRDYLERLAAQESTPDATRALLELAKQSDASSGSRGRNWTRDELYDS